MHPRDVAVATITWARTPAEDASLIDALTRLVALGLPTVVADRGTSETLSRFLTAQPGLQVIPADATAHPGLVRQVQLALGHAAATGRRAILYTEPDKAGFFGECLASGLLDLIARVPDDERACVVLAARSARSLETFPPTQRYTEAVINRLCGERVGVPGDYSYGPFVMPAALVPVVASMDPSLGWGWRHALFVAAHERGLDLQHVVGEHPCPDDQRDEDAREWAHRLRQLSENLRGLIT